MDRGAWQSTVQGATKSRSQPKGFGVHVLGVLPCENTRFLISPIPEDILSIDILVGCHQPLVANSASRSEKSNQC